MEKDYVQRELGPSPSELPSRHHDAFPGAHRRTKRLQIRTHPGFPATRRSLRRHPRRLSNPPQRIISRGRLSPTVRLDLRGSPRLIVRPPDLVARHSNQFVDVASAERVCGERCT